MPFLGIISWNGASRFNGRGIVFSDGEPSLLNEGCPMGGIGFDGGGGCFEKNVGWGAPPSPTMRNPVYNK